MLSNCLFIDDPDSECEVDGVKIDGSFLIVPWACILLLLSKCQKHGCAEQVLPSNVKVSRKGNIIVKTAEKRKIATKYNIIGEAIKKGPNLEHFQTEGMV